MPRPKPDAHRSVAHPVRTQIISTLGHRVMSPVEVARELDLHLNKVAYHFRVLADAGFIERVKTDTRRGAVQTYYRVKDGGHVVLSARLPTEAVDVLARQVRALVVEHGATADGDGERITVAVLRHPS